MFKKPSEPPDGPWQLIRGCPSLRFTYDSHAGTITPLLMPAQGSQISRHSAQRT